MKSKEAKARIKINHLLEEAGWRFFDDENGAANICLEPNVKLTRNELTALGDDFEKHGSGFVDYLLLDKKHNPFIVLEAKKSTLNPLNGKEQARRYANSLNAKYVILSNGDIHYFWNLEKGNPELITSFPSLESLESSCALNSPTNELINTKIDQFYIALSQDPTLLNSFVWKNKDEEIIKKHCIQNNLRVLRYYQLDAIKSIQTAVKNHKTRFLFEMATGTGKTLTAAGVIKLFVRSELANRVLFLVDRLELESQTKKDLRTYLAKDGITIAVYKENQDDWNKANVVISTIQSFTHDNKYKKIFRPTDFDLVISDEAHRVLGASNRAIFEYFIGYKLGLTATPKNYLKGVDFDSDDPREIEKRLLLDTYHIFGCDSGTPTFSYTLNDGVRDGILVNPVVIDARSDITTQLLSENGLQISSDDDNFVLTYKDEEGKTSKTFSSKSFEKEFFSESTNRLFCKTFLENAKRDPITNEIGKSIFFCVSIEHACKITQILNEMADKMYPGKYNSDFAIQITSNISGSQQMTVAFANNNLNGHSKFDENYVTSKSRVAVTVAMMTTGYDCRDLLNICFCRPVFSPSDFIQMKGRGTRIFDFKNSKTVIKKENFKLFDFFGVCEYFEKDFNYNEKISIPVGHNNDGTNSSTGFAKAKIDKAIHTGNDDLSSISVQSIGPDGMKIDRMFYDSFEQKIDVDPTIKEFIFRKDEDGLMNYLQTSIFNKPNEYFTLSKIEQALGLDRHLTLREVARNIIYGTKKYKTRSEILNDVFEDFILLNKEELEKQPHIIPALKEIFIAYLVDPNVREAIKNRKYQELINSQLRPAVKEIKNTMLKHMPVLDYIPYYVTTNAINYEQFC